MTSPLWTRVLRAASALAVSAALAVPSLAQEPGEPSGGAPEPVAIDVGGTARSFGEWASLFATQFGLAAARFAVDLTYESVETGPGGAVFINGLRVTLPVPYGEPRACVLEIDEIASRYSTLALFTGGYLGESSARISGISVPLACLPPEARAVVQLARLDGFEIDALEIDTALDPVTAQADIALRLDARDLVTLDARGRLDYLWVRFPFHDSADEDEQGGSPDPIPSIEFGPIDVTLVDRGLVERLPPFLGMSGMPPDAVAPTAAQVVRAQLGDAKLAEEVEREVARFLAEGGRLALSLRPGEVWFEDLAAMSPPQIVAAFNPSLGAAVRPAIVSPEIVEAARMREGLSPDMAVAVARAHLSGEGLPRNPAEALRIALTHAGDATRENAALRIVAAEAILEGGRAQNGEAAVGIADAYRFALDAGRLGSPVSPLLRRLEARLPATLVAEVQAQALAEWLGDGATGLNRRYSQALEAGDTAEIVAIAGMFESGDGAPRNYAEAYFLALLAEAAGEVGARRMVERIEATASDEAAWAPRLAKARDSATRIWLTSGLAERVSARESGTAGESGAAPAAPPQAPTAPPEEGATPGTAQ